MDQSRLEDIVGTALTSAAAHGATQAEAGVSVGTGLSVTVRHGSVETLEHQRDRSFALTVFFGRRKG